MFSWYTESQLDEVSKPVATAAAELALAYKRAPDNHDIAMAMVYLRRYLNGRGLGGTFNEAVGDYLDLDARHALHNALDVYGSSI